jgi:uncharacterized membrane protein YkoI
MPTSRTKRLLLSGAAAIGVAVGAAGIAGAATGQATPTPAPAQVEADNAQDPSYTSSVTAPQGAESQSETDESAALQSLASITSDQARNAALAAEPGTAGKISLDNENGNVVWSVEITKADGTVTDVKVDAGNGTVLAQDAGDENKSESNGANETPDAGEPAETEAG